MRESVTDMIQVCPKCRVAFLEENGETCRCPTPMFPDEVSRVKDSHNAHQANPGPRAQP